MDLVTYVTSAAVLGHVDGSPRQNTIRNCGWSPSDVGRVLLKSQGKSLDYNFRMDLEMVERLMEVHYRSPLINDPGPIRNLTWQALRIMQGRLLKQLEEMESDGRLAASVSVCNADSYCAVIYWKGKPVGQL